MIEIGNNLALTIMAVALCVSVAYVRGRRR